MSTTAPTAPTFLTLLADQIKPLVESGNAISGRVTASLDKSTNKLVAEMAKTSEDPQVVAWREMEEKTLAKLEENRQKVYAYLRKSLPEGETLSEEQIEALKVQHKEIKAKIKAAIDFAHMQPDYTSDWEQTLPILTTFKGNKSTTGNAGQTGIRRPRISAAAIDGEDFSVTKANGETGVTLTAIAQELVKRQVRVGNKEFKLTAAQLLEALEATDANWSKAPCTEISVQATADTRYLISVTPAE